MAAGAASLTWCALVLIDARVSQRLARQMLESMPPLVETSVARRPAVARGTPLAELSIPRLHLSAVVLHGSDAHTLHLGLGHIENTALPGESGNVAIAGHRDSFFRPLRNVRVDDEILLDTPQGRLHYRVSSFRVVGSHEVSVLNSTKDATLTLVTCYPFWFVGHAEDRFVVRATRVHEATAATSVAQAARLREPAGAPVAEAVATRDDDASDPRDPGAATITPREPEIARGPNGSFRAGEARDLGTSDNLLVQRAIELFRLTFNNRLVARGDFREGGLLRFEACDIAVDDSSATAICVPAPQSPDKREPPWTFRIAKTSGVWTIKSIESDGP